MADTITCPVCGETNPADAEFCQSCQSRLQPLTGPLRGENLPIQPGDAPTKKATGELEPVLPRWLRDAREQARQSAGEGGGEGEVDQKPTPSPQPSDLLAGLESQKQEPEDETPEWVVRIAGKPSQPKRPEPLMAKYVELHDEDEPAPSQAAQKPTPKPETSVKPPEKDELGEWFRQAASATKPRRETAAGLPQSAEAPALITGGEEVPSWLKGLEAQAEAEQTSGGGQNELPLPSKEEPKLTIPELPAWLKNLGAEPTSLEPRSPEEQLPAWLRGTKKAEEGSAGPPQAAAQGTGTPDWISSLPSAGPEVAATNESPAAETESNPVASEPETGAPAFTADALSTRDVDAIFASMQTPDWLAEATRGTTATPENLPPAAQEQPAIAQAELPSWVQAMRPVESEVPVEPPPPVDLRLEEGGPLAGLQGVLPVILGAGAATSKPQAQAAKLEATERQQAHAELLEKILAAEVTPIPMKAMPLVGPQRSLRWGITAILLIILGATVTSRSQVFPLPSAVPTESLQAVQTVEAIPAGAPVLVVFDYQPATVGEMEASAASLIDHLLLLRHPELALISTSPTGSALAERFISTTLAERAYQRGVQYVDLGFLAGGPAGVHDFAQSPATALPLGADSTPVWDSAVLQRVKALSDFASIIVLTDSPESGRVWIEQTAGLRGGGSMVIVSSAQAGPMLVPYVDSGQINGLVAGVNGAVGAEQANGGLPGFVRRYWDAYSTGLYLAVFMTVAGGLWSLWRGMQDRRPEQVG